MTPPIFAVFSADEPVLGEEAALAEELPGPAVLAAGELPHAAAISATPARLAGAQHRLRIAHPRSLKDYPSVSST
ncbi:MAG TPA: hypothetical protein VH307_18350 [Streptosporangiaceae bacterium]|nr:hypothetical protein [Streptosporangiaceae bacterium]